MLLWPMKLRRIEGSDYHVLEPDTKTTSPVLRPVTCLQGPDMQAATFEWRPWPQLHENTAFCKFPAICRMSPHDSCFSGLVRAAWFLHISGGLPDVTSRFLCTWLGLHSD